MNPRSNTIIIAAPMAPVSKATASRISWSVPPAYTQPATPQFTIATTAAKSTAAPILTRGSTSSGPASCDLSEPLGLAEPDESLRSGLQELAAIAVTQLRLGPAALGEDWTLGTDALLVAAAIGAATTPEHGVALLDTLPLATTLGDWIARHALIGPALAYLPAPLAGQLLALSPLTGLLQHPPRDKPRARCGWRAGSWGTARAAACCAIPWPPATGAASCCSACAPARHRGVRVRPGCLRSRLCFRPAPWLEQVRAAREVLTAPPRNSRIGAWKTPCPSPTGGRPYAHWNASNPRRCDNASIPATTTAPASICANWRIG
jgi:hypothetical protein